MDVDEAARRAARLLPSDVRPRTRRTRLVAFGLAVFVVLVLVGSVVDAIADYLGLRLDLGSAAETLNQHPYVAGVGLLGVEEAGIPLPISGDFLIVYSAAAIARDPYALTALWIAFETVVLAGSAVLFLAARRWGRRLLQGSIGYALHLTPERLDRAERWFRRWGIWAVIVGRHVPGFRITTTLVAAVFGVSLPVFVFGVAISAGVWLAFWMGVGVAVGPKAQELVGGHRYGSLIVLGGALLLGTLYVLFRLWLRPAASRPPSEDRRRP
jgi:membrane protein DedA with SNARE-associated domain